VDTFDWPLSHLPSPALAGRFRLADRNFATTYCGRNHALHLHGYTGAMRLAGRTIALGAGDLTISPAGLPSSYHLDTPGRHWCIHFETAAAVDQAVQLPLHIQLGSAASAAEEQFAHIGRLLASNTHRDRARSALALQELLLWVVDHVEQPGARETAAERAAALIDERFHETLTVADIASTLGASQAHLARSFRARFGTTMQYRLLVRRMTHARYLLESTDLPIWRVAERMGIPDPQHFNKCVRRFFGESPSAVRGRSGPVSPVDPDR
jgi:AraC-like DNA-binding protein